MIGATAQHACRVKDALLGGGGTFLKNEMKFSEQDKIIRAFQTGQSTLVMRADTVR